MYSCVLKQMTWRDISFSQIAPIRCYYEAIQNQFSGSRPSCSHLDINATLRAVTFQGCLLIRGRKSSNPGPFFHTA